MCRELVQLKQSSAGSDVSTVWADTQPAVGATFKVGDDGAPLSESRDYQNRGKAVQEHSGSFKMLLTLLIFADVVTQVGGWEKVRVVQGLDSLQPLGIYTVWEVPSTWVAFQAANTIRPPENTDQWRQSVVTVCKYLF